MKETVIISPIKPGKIYLGGKFLDKHAGKEYFVTRDLRVYDVFDKKFEQENANNQFSFKFTQSQAEFRIEYDPDSTDIQDVNRKKFVEVYLRYPSMLNTENILNPNLGNPDFKMFFLNRIQKSESFTMRDKIEAGKKYCELDYPQCQDVGFQFGINSYKYKRSELDAMLIGKNMDGLLMIEQNILNFLAYDPKNQKTIYRTLINKAKYLKIISVSAAGYEMNNEYLGKEIEDVIGFFNGNSQRFDFMKAEIERKTPKSEDDIRGRVMNPTSEKRVQVIGYTDDPEFEGLLKQAEELGLDYLKYSNCRGLRTAILTKSRHAKRLEEITA